MHERTLGQGQRVSAVGLGCMGMSQSYGPNPGDRDAMIAVLRGAADRGVTFFDTAESYGPYVNEELVGEALAPLRGQVVIATKFGWRIEDGKSVGLDSRPEQITRVADASLLRLRVDTIDLFYQHRVDPKVPIEDTVGAMARLVEEGKVRHLGLSEAGADTLRRAAVVHPIAALQSEYSLWERGVEDDIVTVARELGVGFVPYSPLGRGFLTGQITRREDLGEGDYRLRDPRYSEENFAANMAIVAVVKRIADAHGVSPAQIALAWLLAQGDDVVPIPGSKRRATLEDSMAAADVTLSEDDLRTLDEAAPRGQTAGPRYGEQMMAMTRL